MKGVRLEEAIADVMDVWRYSIGESPEAYRDVAKRWVRDLGVSELPSLTQRINETLAARPVDFDAEASEEPLDDLLACFALLSEYVRVFPLEVLGFLPSVMATDALPAYLDAIAEGSYGLGTPTISGARDCVVFALNHPYKLTCRCYSLLRVIVWNLAGRNKHLLSQVLEKVPPACEDARVAIQQLLES